MASEPESPRRDGNQNVPFVPLSHPFVERLIGTIRRECVDHLLFWTAADLELKLSDFQNYYNGFAFTGPWRIRGQFRLWSPNVSISNVMHGRDIVAVYTKRQEPHEDEFAIDTYPCE